MKVVEQAPWDDAVWDEGEWLPLIDCRDIAEEHRRSHLSWLEHQAHYSKAADAKLVSVYDCLIGVAAHHLELTGRHLQVYGDIAELYASIAYGVKLHRNYAKGSDGPVGDDFVEVECITPMKKGECVMVDMTRHFSKLVVVRITPEFEVSGRIIRRRDIPGTSKGMRKVKWSALPVAEDCPADRP